MAAEGIRQDMPEQLADSLKGLPGVGDHSTVVPVEQVGTGQMAENQPN